MCLIDPTIRHDRSGGRPSAPTSPARAKAARQSVVHIPDDVDECDLKVDGAQVHLTNLRKIFFPKLKLTKRDLLQYYADVSRWLLPHLQDRAMVMKRYPNGIDSAFFFMKRTLQPHPAWLSTCPIKHGAGNIIDFPVIQNLAALLWVVNLGCIDLNPWYARCDDVWRPDFLHFDLDPVPGARLEKVLETALKVRDALAKLKIKSYAKTTGSRGNHVYVPIVRGPKQKEVWTFAKRFSFELAAQNPSLITAEYRVAKRPRDRVLFDYNQNAWNRTLASVYSVRPKQNATVSTPVSWQEVERGLRLEDFTLRNVPRRLPRLGDLWKPLQSATGRTDLEKVL